MHSIFINIFNPMILFFIMPGGINSSYNAA